MSNPTKPKQPKHGDKRYSRQTWQTRDGMWHLLIRVVTFTKRKGAKPHWKPSGHTRHKFADFKTQRAALQAGHPIVWKQNHGK